MTYLPEGWNWVELRHLGDWYGGATPSKSVPRYWQNGTVPWLSPKDMGPRRLAKTQDRISTSAIDESRVRLVPEGSVALVVRSGILERTLPVAVVPFAVTLNQDMKAVVPYANIDNRWIAWGLRAFERQIIRTARKSGTTVASLETSRLMRFRIPVPPIDEQRRIITQAEDYIERIEMQKSSLGSVLSRTLGMRDRIIPTWVIGISRGTSNRLSVADVDDGNLPELLPGWQWKRLDEISEVVGGVTKDARKQNDPSFVEVPYLRVANVQRGSLELADVSTIRVPERKASQLRLQIGDVLLNEGGDRDKLGRGWIWEGQISNCIHQNHVFRARIHDRIVHPKIIAWHANGFGKEWCERNGRQTTNLASISLRRIRKLPVPVPPEHLDQQAVVREVERRTEALRRATAEIESAISLGDVLKHRILHLAFSNNLT